MRTASRKVKMTKDTKLKGRGTAVAARNVLDDCRWALIMHTPDLQAEAFRVSWVALVALLRAVGHVLVKVDAAEGDSHLKTAIGDHWKRLNAGKAARAPAIYWDFIEQERNTVLKQYALGAKRIAQTKDDRVRWRVDLSSMRSGGGPGLGRTRMGFPNTIVTSEIAEGPFKGQDEREVVEKAIEWWQTCLAEIESAAQLARTTPAPH